jgi:magnesium transporter
MDIYLISDSGASPASGPPISYSPGAFLWLDATHDEIAADPEKWRASVEQTSGIHIYDLHLTDAANLRHPSYFDSTQDYAMLVFRKLAPQGTDAADHAESSSLRRIPPALAKLATQPVTFVLTDRVLVTVHAAGSRTIDAARVRLLDYKSRPNGKNPFRPPASPAELMLRLLNAMVDQYLDLRQPLTSQIDRWQRALLNPRKPFKDWMALLDARIELHKLDRLCEEQHDALQELRDHFIDGVTDEGNSRSHDLLLVRVNDVMEHVTRVLNHARRLEASIESAVQIHFSAMAHRTSEIMRTLTVITALFMPLTLVTGIFGMNFIDMPLLKNKSGFWITMGIMAVIVVGLLIFFRRRRYLEDRILGDER